MQHPPPRHTPLVRATGLSATVRAGAAALAVTAAAGLAVIAPSAASAASCYGTGGTTGRTSAAYVASSGCLGQKIRAVISCAPSSTTYYGNWAFYGSTTRVACPVWERVISSVSYQVAPGGA